MTNTFKIEPVEDAEVWKFQDREDCSEWEARRRLTESRLWYAIQDVKYNGTLQDKVEFILDALEHMMLDN